MINFGLGKNLFFPQTSDCVSSDWLQSNHLAIRPTSDILKFILCYEAWGNKSSWTAVMNNTFLLFYSLKPHSNIWILIHQNWLEPISLPKHPFLLSPLLFAAGDISHRGMSATQRLKFHTDDANQFLHNKSSSRGVPNINLSNFMCLLVDFGKAPAKLKCFFYRRLYSANIDCFVRDSSLLHLTFVAFCLLSVIRKQ